MRHLGLSQTNDTQRGIAEATHAKSFRYGIKVLVPSKQQTPYAARDLPCVSVPVSQEPKRPGQGQDQRRRHATRSGYVSGNTLYIPPRRRSFDNSRWRIVSRSLLSKAVQGGRGTTNERFTSQHLCLGGSQCQPQQLVRVCATGLAAEHFPSGKDVQGVVARAKTSDQLLLQALAARESFWRGP